MKKLMSLSLLMLSLSGSLMAGEIQTINGDEAYQLYLKLPGKKCLEYSGMGYVAYTKYQTRKCSDTQTDNSKWVCTVQMIKYGKINEVLSADCSREI